MSDEIPGHTAEYAQVCSCGFTYEYFDRRAHIAAVIAGPPGNDCPCGGFGGNDCPQMKRTIPSDD